MQTEAIFENIAERIQSEIGNAQKSVFVAVAWFTNKNLFDELVKKANSGCHISLLVSDDAINNQSRITFEELAIHNSKVYKVGNGDTQLMHNKFCVIDYSTVITGSYNWSYKAESNFENVIVTYNDTKLAEQFISEFDNIRKRYYPDEPKREEQVFPLDKVVRRLEILKNFILLEDLEDIQDAIAKLKDYAFNEDIREIIEAINRQAYALAIVKIQAFITLNQQLSIWIDPEVAALKLELKTLENQLSAFDNEKVELEKLLSAFQRRHTMELGETVLEILKLRKLKYKADQAKFEEAENDEREYSTQLEEDRAKEVFELTEEQKADLKKQYRKASTLCHPDKVNEEMRESAQAMFIALKAAYDANDLKGVAAILADLERGNYFHSRSETVSEAVLLKSAIALLARKVRALETEIVEIKSSETFVTIVGIEDWDAYFGDLKEKLLRELERLVLEVGEGNGE